jgi:hypothetical protein
MSRTQYPVNYGRTAQFPTVPAPGGFLLTNNVQLISERVASPRQWLVTVLPITLARAVGIVPWLAPWNGIPGALPVAGDVPWGSSLASRPYRVGLAWGAGGVRSLTEFDYPANGGTFAVVADTLDLNVYDPVSGTTVIPDAGSAPVFGAFMAPGTPAYTSRMTFLDVTANVHLAEVAYYAVKPFARRVFISQSEATTAATPYIVEFLDAGGNVVLGDLSTNAADVAELPVPCGSTIMRVTGTAGGAGHFVTPVWEIELS